MVFIYDKCFSLLVYRYKMQVQVDLFASLLTLTVLKVQHDIFWHWKKGWNNPLCSENSDSMSSQRNLPRKGETEASLHFWKGGKRKGFCPPLCASDADIDPKRRTFLFWTDSVAFPIKVEAGNFRLFPPLFSWKSPPPPPPPPPALQRPKVIKILPLRWRRNFFPSPHETVVTSETFAGFFSKTKY